MARAKMQMQHMQMRMKIPYKHDTLYAHHFIEANSEHSQAYD